MASSTFRHHFVDKIGIESMFGGAGAEGSRFTEKSIAQYFSLFTEFFSLMNNRMLILTTAKHFFSVFALKTSYLSYLIIHLVVSISISYRFNKKEHLNFNRLPI